MRPRWFGLFGALLLGGCTGSIGEGDPRGTAPGGGDPSGSAASPAAGASSSPNPPGSPGAAPADTWAFTCEDSAAGEPRRLRRLSKSELRAQLVSVLSGTSLQSTAPAKIEAAAIGFPEDT